MVIAQAQKGTKMHKHQRNCFVLFELSFRKYAARKAGQELELSLREFEILRSLIRRRGEIVISDQLLDEIWDMRAARYTVDTISPGCGRRSNKTVESSAYRTFTGSPIASSNRRIHRLRRLRTSETENCGLL